MQLSQDVFIHELQVEFSQRLPLGRFEKDGPGKGKGKDCDESIGIFLNKDQADFIRSMIRE